METNQMVLLAFGIFAFLALGYTIYRQMHKDEPQNTSDDFSEQDYGTEQSEIDSDSYDDSEIYSD